MKTEKLTGRTLMSRFLAVLLALVMAIGVTACGNDSSSKSDKDDEEEITEESFIGAWNWGGDDSTSLLLDEDGEGVYTDSGEEYDIEWKLKGEKVTFKADGEKYTCTLGKKGDTLKLKSENGNINITLDKKKSSKKSGKKNKKGEEDDVVEEIPQINTAAGGVGDLLGKVVSEPKKPSETVEEMPVVEETADVGDELSELTDTAAEVAETSPEEAQVTVTVEETYPFGTLYDVGDASFNIFANDSRSTVLLVPKGWGVAQDEEKLYYIGEDYEEGFAYIPYILVGKFNAQEDTKAFVEEYGKKAMAPGREDFVASPVEETGDLLGNGSMSYGVEYSYTVSGYTVKDYRYFFEKDGVLWMVGLKETEDYTEDNVTYLGCVLYGIVMMDDLATMLQ